MPAADSFSVAGLRLTAGLEAAEIGDVFWLRGPAWSEPLRLALRGISGLERFELLPRGRLLAEGTRVPRGRLPELRWLALQRWFPVTLPTVHGLSTAPLPAALRLVRSLEELPAGGLLAELSAWLEFATGAAEIRLHPLRFAAARDGRVWIEGKPLPALPGRRFSIREGVAIPGGFQHSPALSFAAIRRRLGLAEGDVALAAESGEWEIIKAEQFVPVTRSAVRATAEAPGHG